MSDVEILSLASAITSLIDFGLKVASITVDLHKSATGITKDQEQLYSSVQRLDVLCNHL